MRVQTILRLWWHRWFLRHDEFHRSLDMDVDAMIEMDSEQREGYLDNLILRRQTAHKAELKEERHDD